MNNKIVHSDKPKILFEDDDFMVVEKPEGIVTYDEKQKDPSVIDFFREDVDKKVIELFPKRLGLAHRLDKGTSGALIIAKNLETLSVIQQAFKDRKVEKEYTAIVHGQLNEKTLVKLPIGRTRIGLMAISAATTKEAESLVEPIKLFEGFTLIKIIPKSGRTHQIRVHLKSIGHPVVGDGLYGTRYKAKDTSPARMFLHASRLAFVHPRTGKKFVVVCPIPESFAEFTRTLTAI